MNKCEQDISKHRIALIFQIFMVCSLTGSTSMT